MTIEEARTLLNEVRKKESTARSQFNKFKTEEYNNAFKKVKAERRKVVKLCKSVGMNVSPSGVEQPEGAPPWIKKKYRTAPAMAPVQTNKQASVQNSDNTGDIQDDDLQPEILETEELTKYINFLKYLKAHEVITDEVEAAAGAFIKEDFKAREEKLNKHEETLKQLVNIGEMTMEQYSSCLEALREDLFEL